MNSCFHEFMNNSGDIAGRCAVGLDDARAQALDAGLGIGTRCGISALSSG